ncbi:related to MNT4 - putative alpha-1,3-mannosyltransferase [Ustilago sp. UG-2017b]|nr:related to MNT4 - putative alpha-1,3-mannosyltransferase [Ustilago sp. UG-2017b]
MVLPAFQNLYIGQNGKPWSFKLRGMGGKVRALLFLATIVWLMRMALQIRPSLSPMFGMHVRALDAAAHDIWTDYILSHPVEADERYGFREMGFRTHAYAELARTHQIGRLERIEEKLWSFAPGAPEIRRKALQVDPINPEQQVSRNDATSVDAKVKAILKKSGSLTTNQTSSLLAEAQREDEVRGGKRRGIVITVNRYTALAALQNVQTIRELHGCLLPIEVYYHTDDEMPSGLADMFRDIPRATVIDLEKLPLFTNELENEGGHHPGLKEVWSRESLALLASSFQEIIIVEPQVVFLQNPSLLLSHPTFASTGTLFFRAEATPVDRASQYLVAFLKRQIDQGAPSQQLAESAFFSHSIGSRMDMDVVVLDKSRPGVLAALFMNAWMRRKPLLAMFWGAYPKMMNEGLWLAFELAQIAYAFENTWPGAIGRFDGEWDDHSPLLCAPRTIQFLSPEAAHQKLSRKYFSLFQSQGSKKNRVKGVNGRLSQNAAGEKPFWFHGGYLIPGQEKESYFTPNVYARNVPPYTTADAADSNNCLYGATLNRLKDTTIPSTLSKAIDVAHDTFKKYRPTLMYHSPIPALQAELEVPKKKKKKE